MKQVYGLTATYSSDEFGICSALYELGGMVVMHDASGCNSTYTTHDEPRWYDMDSMIFISAISEAEAIMGDDDKFIRDLVGTAAELHPKFIALVGAPIPYMIGTDLDAIARIVSEETGLPCFGFAANGMNHYTKGISMALERITEYAVGEFEERVSAERAAVCEMRNNTVSIMNTQQRTDLSEKYKKTVGKTHFSGGHAGIGYKDEPAIETIQEEKIVVNILGATPLDFSLNGSVEAMKRWVQSHGMQMNVCLSMGCAWEELPSLKNADVNLVVSYGGLAAARVLEQTCGIPYVVGVPFGECYSERLAENLRQTGTQKRNIDVSTAGGSAERAECANRDVRLIVESYKREINAAEQQKVCDSKAAEIDLKGTDLKSNRIDFKSRKVVLIGESVFSVSLAEAIEADAGVSVRVLCPLDTEEALLRTGDVRTPEEDDVMRELADAEVVIADPLYGAIANGKTFIALPHEAFSGRIYDAVNPNLVAKKIKRKKVC